MRVLLESEYQKLWCPKALAPSYMDRNISATNRDNSGQDKSSCRCIGSSCAAWAWETERPKDGFVYSVIQLNYSASDEAIAKTKEAQATYGYEFVEVIQGTLAKSARFRKPWQPIGYCAAFHRQPSGD